MEFEPDVHRKLNAAGALFGLALGFVLSWTTQIYPALALRGVPINAESFGMSGGGLAVVIAIQVLGVALGGFLVAYFWERLWVGLLLGALITALVQVSTAYVTTVTSLAGNENAELIMFGLPLALVYGGLVWFLGGLFGSAIERLALRGAAGLFQRGAAQQLLGWALALAVGAALGLVAGGNSDERADAIAAARAVQGAVTLANDQPLAGPMPEGFRVSDPALGALRGFGERIDQPYQIYFEEHDGREVVMDVRFQDGLAVRCVSNGAHISRCFETFG